MGAFSLGEDPLAVFFLDLELWEPAMTQSSGSCRQSGVLLVVGLRKDKDCLVLLELRIRALGGIGGIAGVFLASLLLLTLFAFFLEPSGEGVGGMILGEESPGVRCSSSHCCVNHQVIFPCTGV